MFLSGHCCDEGSPLPTAFLRWQEGDGTLGSQTSNSLFQNSGETTIKKIKLFAACCAVRRIKVKGKKIVYSFLLSQRMAAF